VNPQCPAKEANVGFSRGRPLAGAEHDGAHAVVQQELAAPAEVGERGLVGSQKICHALAQEAKSEAPAVTEGHHEDVDLGAHATQWHGDLAPVALSLLARAGLEAALRQRSHRRRHAQRRHRAAHDHIAAREPALRPHLLPQDARRVVDLGRPLGQPLLVRVQQAARIGTLIRLPRRLLQATANRLRSTSSSRAMAEMLWPRARRS
jgi:hypothetical protein